MENMTL